MKKVLWVLSALLLSFVVNSSSFFFPMPFIFQIEPHIAQSYTSSSGGGISSTHVSFSSRKSIFRYLRPAIQKVQECTNKSFNFCVMNKFRLFVCLLGFSYTSLCYVLIKGNSYLSRATLWSSWKSEHTLETLLVIPQHNLAQELIHEIQKRYVNPRNPTDFLTPLVSFMQDIEYELKQIKFYIQVTKTLIALRVNRLIPIDIRKIQHAPQRLQRLLYLKNVFHTWTAEHKIETNKLNHEIKKQRVAHTTRRFRFSS